MIGTSTAEYVFIRGCILFLHNVAPLGILYCTCFIFAIFFAPQLQIYRAPFFFEAWLAVEAAAFFLLFLPYHRYLQRPARHPELSSRKEREVLFARCNAQVKDPEQYLRHWFLGASPDQIREENVKDFLRWAFFDTGDVCEEHEEEIEHYLKEMESLLGRPLKPGRGSAKALRLTLDPVDCLHRSILWYICIFVVDVIAYCRMLYHGYHFHRSPLWRFFTVFPLRPLTLTSAYTSPVKHLTYWHRPHNSKTRLPILFIHGIGVGLYPYHSFLRDLGKGEELGVDLDIGVIAIEIMPVSSRITHEALGRDEMVQEIHAILKHHGWGKFVLVSHSYGSVITTHLLKSPLTGQSIGPVVLIDPITFLLHLPDVAYNFTARPPKRANEYQLWYFGSKDIGVAHTLARRFFWSENVLWVEDLGLEKVDSSGSGGKGRDVIVCLSGKDLIVNTRAVRRYLQKSQVPNQKAIPLKASDLRNGKTVVLSNGEAKKPPTTNIKREEEQEEEEEEEEEENMRWMGSGLKILWFEQLDHAQVFDDPRDRARVIKAINTYSNQI